MGFNSGFKGLMKLEFYQHEQYSDTKFHKIYVQWEPQCFIRTDGRTDRQKGMTPLIISFCNFVCEPKNSVSRSQTEQSLSLPQTNLLTFKNRASYM